MQRHQLAKAQKQIADSDRLLIWVYEYSAGGKLSDDKFSTMNQNYETEQDALEQEVAQLQQDIDVQE